MIRYSAMTLVAMALCACSPGAPAPLGVDAPGPTGMYAMASMLDAAEKAALLYQQAPGADPAVVARLKDLDASAYAVIGPAAASGGGGAADLAAAQAALTALTTYLGQAKGK